MHLVSDVGVVIFRDGAMGGGLWVRCGGGGVAEVDLFAAWLFSEGLHVVSSSAVLTCFAVLEWLLVV